MGKAGRKFKVEPQVLIETINLHRDELFQNGKVAGPSAPIYKAISHLLDNKISPYAVYVFIKRNKLAKVNYSDWGLVGANEVEETANSSLMEPVDDEGNQQDLSSDSEAQPETVKHFTMTLSPEEWDKMAPKEFFYKKGSQESTKAYKALTPNVWTHIVNEHFWEHTKTKCCLVFKRGNVNESGLPYIKITGFCKNCDGIFIGTIDSTPKEGKRVLVDCDYSSKKLCSEVQSKRQLKGIVKENALRSLIQQKKSAMYYHIQEANRVMNHGDIEPSHLPSTNALRCAKYKKQQEEYCDTNIFESINTAKYTTPFREAIHDIGLNKFFVRYWTPAQLNSYREFVRQNPEYAIIVDATGGLVKKIPRPFKNKSSGILLYQARAFLEETGVEFPVFQMISECHDNMAIYAWFADWLNDGAPSPKTFISDRSVAILSAAVKAFTQYKSLSEYIKKCYDIIFLGGMDKLPMCFIRCDIAHLIKSITTWHPLKELTTNVRAMYIRCLAKIIKNNTIEKVKIILSALFKVATSRSVGKTMVNGLPSEDDTPAERVRSN